MTDNIDIMDELDVQDMAVDGYDADASDDETGQLYEHFRFEAAGNAGEGCGSTG